MKTKKKKPYVKPKTKSEDLVAFGALCNGTTNLGRKETTGSPSSVKRRKSNLEGTPAIHSLQGT